MSSGLTCGNCSGYGEHGTGYVEHELLYVSYNSVMSQAWCPNCGVMWMWRKVTCPVS